MMSTSDLVASRRLIGCDTEAVGLVLQPGLFEEANDINGLAERAARGSFCYTIDFTHQFRLGSRSPDCSIRRPTLLDCRSVHAVQSQRVPSPSHPEAAASGSQLGRI